VAPLFLPLVREWLEMTEQYDDEQLRLIVDFYRQMEQVFRDHVVRLREPAPAAPPAAAAPPAEAAPPA